MLRQEREHIYLFRYLHLSCLTCTLRLISLYKIIREFLFSTKSRALPDLSVTQSNCKILPALSASPPMQTIIHTRANSLTSCIRCASLSCKFSFLGSAAMESTIIYSHIREKITQDKMPTNQFNTLRDNHFLRRFHGALQLLTCEWSEHCDAFHHLIYSMKCGGVIGLGEPLRVSPGGDFLNS